MQEASLIVQHQDTQLKHSLRAGDNLIGRHPDCLVGIVQPSVSGRHAIIHAENGGYYVEDVGSRNGTYVNQTKVVSRVQLAHNDMIQFGDATARFDCPALGGETNSARSLADAPDSETVGSLQIAEAQATITAEVQATRFVGLDVNAEAKLKAVLEISNSLAGKVDLKEMLPRILDTLFQIFSYADRGCIMLKDETTGEMQSRAMKHRRLGEDATVRLSRTIVNKVLDEKKGVLSADASMDQAFNASESIADLKIRSVMCVPLLDRNGAPLGVISVDSQNPLGQFKQDDLDILMTVANQAALCYETAQLIDSYAQKQKQDGELRIAEQVQQALLPNDLPRHESYEFFASYDAAQAVGGDYYDWFNLGHGKICLSFGDVAGKGVPGALIMSRMSSCVQSTIRHVQDVVEAIKAINDHMCDTSVEGRFVTYLLAVVDTEHHTVELANAGHMSPIIRKADGTVAQFDEERVGTPIGVLEDYPYESEVRELEPGDMVVFVTDGVDEAMNPAGEFYTGERLLEFVKGGTKSAEELGRTLLADVRRHADGRPQNDDITIMTFGRVE